MSLAVEERHVVRRAERVRDLLEREGVRYEAISHGEAWTAQEAAAASHVPGREVAKAVVLRDACGACVLAVLPRYGEFARVARAQAGQLCFHR